MVTLWMRTWLAPSSRDPKNLEVHLWMGCFDCLSYLQEGSSGLSCVLKIFYIWQLKRESFLFTDFCNNKGFVDRRSHKKFVKLRVLHL